MMAGDAPMRSGWFWRAMCAFIGHKWSWCDIGYCDRCHYRIPS